MRLVFRMRGRTGDGHPPYLSYGRIVCTQVIAGPLTGTPDVVHSLASTCAIKYNEMSLPDVIDIHATSLAGKAVIDEHFILPPRIVGAVDHRTLGTALIDSACLDITVHSTP